MDPKFLGSSEWHQVVYAVNLFWFFAAFLVVAALCFGLAHAFIPSLRNTGQISIRGAAARPILYVLSAISLVIAAFILANALVKAIAVLRVIYPRWWV